MDARAKLLADLIPILERHREAIPFVILLGNGWTCQNIHLASNMPQPEAEAFVLHAASMRSGKCDN